MRIFKITLFVLILLVGGFLFFQFWMVEKEDADLAPVTVLNSSPAGELSMPVGLVSESEDSAAELISGSENADIQWTDRNPAAKRVRKIYPNPEWMTPEPVLKAGGVITLALFEDAVFEAKLSDVTRYPNGAVGMTAQLQGADQGVVYLSYCDGVLRALVEVSARTDYAIRYVSGDDTHYALEIDPVNTVVLEGAEPAAPDRLEEITISGDAVAVANGIEDAPVGSIIIDVMIVYTPAALEAEGSVENMNDNIALTMQQANAAHANSDTKVYLNLVHSRLTSYVEIDYGHDLTNLTYTSDGFMDEIHAVRTQYGADLVCLFKTDPTYGGYGWLLNRFTGHSAYAFCWVNVNQSDRLYTTVHEWGHNMGCHHSKTQAGHPGSGLYSYSSGWQWDDLLAHVYSPFADDGFCTIMTYQNYDGDAANGYEYERVAHFSNPDIDYVGASTNATGDVSDGNNALTIRNVRTVVANYRDAPDQDYDGIPNEWEVLYFGGSTNAVAGATASNGVNTVLQAYIAGLDPTDPDSLFQANLTNGFVVQWNTISGRIYSVFGSTNLQESFQPLETNILWPQASWTDTVKRTENFYQIDVKLAE